MITRLLAIASLLLAFTLPAGAQHAAGVLNNCWILTHPELGAQCFTVFGHNPAIDTDTDPEEVWGGPTPGYNWPAAAGTWYISSADAGDDQMVIVRGLDAEWELQKAVVTLNGLTFVAIDGTWIRLLDSFNIDSTAITGAVYISSDNTDTEGGADGIPDDTSTVHGFYETGEQGTEQTPFSVPLGHVCHVTDVTQSLKTGLGGNRSVDIIVQVRSFGGVFVSKFQGSLSNLGTSFSTTANAFPAPIPERTDISITANTSANGSDVSVSYTVACVYRP